jgi:HK97 family phage portal protein
MPSLIQRFQNALKAFQFPGSNSWLTGWGTAWRSPWRDTTSNRDWVSEAGDLTLNSAVMACLGWITRVWPEAPLRVYSVKSDGKKEIIAGHELAELLQKPNPHYPAGVLWTGTLVSLYLDGNAYWFVNRNALGQPVELIYLPHHLVEPKWSESGGEFIGWYDYSPDGKVVRLEVENIVHFRDGFDPDNMRKGQSRLRSALKEIVTDNQGAAYSSSVLANMGIPGVLLSPDPTLVKDGGRISFSEADAERLKVDWQRKTTGDERGKPMVLSIPMKVESVGFSPEQMVLRDARQIPEERIAALIGIPAVVVGLGAGLDRSTYNNVSEAREQAYENCIIPMQTLIAQTLDLQLLPAYGEGTDTCGFDLDDVRVLQADENALMVRVSLGYEKGILKRSEARELVGQQVETEDEVYFVDPVQQAEERQQNLEMQTQAREAQLQAMRERPALGPATVREEVPARKALPFPHSGDGMKAALSLEEALQSFRSRMLKQETAAVRDVTNAYLAAEKRILGKLEALEARINAAREEGQEITPDWIERQRRYFELLEQIENEFTQLGATGERRLAAAQSQMLSFAQVDARELAFRAAGTAPPGISVNWNRLPSAALENLVGFASDGSPLRDLFDAIGPAASQSVREVLAAGIAAGENPRVIARGVKAALGVPRARAENIARTEVLRAYRETARQSYQANRDIVNGWIWHAALSEETCPACWAMHGTKHSIDEKLDDHPQGRCVAVPVTKSWAEITGDDSIPDTRPQVVPGPELFAQMPADEQRRIVGPEAYRLMQQGQIRLTDMVHQTSDQRWGTMRRASTLQEATAHAAQGVGT